MTPTVSLRTGIDMPRVGLGTWRMSDGQAEAAVEIALRLGYRAIDTAAVYDNEFGVGAGMRASGVPREDIRVTTKLWNTDHGAARSVAALHASLDRLGLDYVDTYMIHWPVPHLRKYVETWRALEQLHASGRIRTLAVSNFTEQHLRMLLDCCAVVPAVNQVEVHPFFQQRDLRLFHDRHGIVTQAWSPLGSGLGLLDIPPLKQIAQQHRRSPAQVLLRWHLQLGNVAVPKSSSPTRLAENLDVFDFSLSESDMAVFAALDGPSRWGPDPDSPSSVTMAA